MLEVTDLVAGYGRIDAVKGVSVALQPGEAVCLLGMNGAGKSTLVKAIAGWLPARQGRISLDGVDITRQKPWRRCTSGLGVVPEGGRVFRDLTVEENLRVTGGADWARGLELFAVLGERRGQLAGSLSGGERQMLAMARALANQPRYLVLDEVSFGLMPRAVDAIFERLAALRADGLGLLVIEQQEQRALAFCGRGYVIAHGVIVAEGDTARLAADEAVRQAYLGG
ncbi:MAG: ATP-binding cassette domain-containing protein [Micromonosporaceae bacterium]|nr:ATP-binding cassette domain-containing protein [Micromonosporaceae bacterium]